MGVLIKNIDIVEKKMRDDPRMRDSQSATQNWVCVGSSDLTMQDNFFAIKKVLTQQLPTSKQNDTSANSKNTS